jgi:hypothetical protein
MHVGAVKAPRFGGATKPQWRGEIPRTILIARDGTTTLIEGVADLASVKTWLDAQRGDPNNGAVSDARRIIPGSTEGE